MLPVLGMSGCPSKPELLRLEIGGGALWVEIADTDAERAEGLMHRKSLPEDRGMLFVYEQDQRMAFWMKDTIVPLSIAFIAADGRIVEIFDMKPLSLKSVQSTRSVRYALEVNQGALLRMGVGPGDYVRFPAAIR